MEMEYIDLARLMALLKAGVEDVFPDRVWVRAEIASINHKQNGHCYLELSQSEGGMVVSKAKATIWASRWNFIECYFREVTGSPLAPGMEILARVQVNFHPLYGLSLNIDEVDPDFTLGASERQKRQTVKKLSENGLMDLQKGLSLPPLPYSLAIVSAPGAAGLGDFMHHLVDNEYGFVFDVDFFEALMQGEQAADSMIIALEQIASCGKGYDAVLILRGGGSDLDLACFDDYYLAEAIALCPVPVITAIGHDKDYHVADMVAHSFVKTPTALADMFLDCFIAEDQRISSMESRLRMAFSGRFSALSSGLELYGARLLHAVQDRISGAMHAVDLIESRIGASDPRMILGKGFVLALDKDGVRLSSAASVRTGDPIRVMFPDGTVRADVTGIE